MWTRAFAPRAAYLLLLALNAATALEWQDCGLQSDAPALRLLKYAHDPDPIVADAPSTISKTWQHFGGTVALTGLSERVYIDRKLPGARAWTPYFNNTFAVCGTGPFQHDVCPVAPNATFAYVDHHPASHSPPATFRAREEYFDGNGTWIGCATIVYRSVAA